MLESDITGDSPTENARAYNATNGAANSPEEEENALLSALYDTYCATVYGMAAHFVGVGPIAEAVVEEVFVRAWRAGVDEWILSDEANDSRDHGGSDPSLVACPRFSARTRAAASPTR